METFELDLAKYGLKHLETTAVAAYSDEDIDRLINAFALEIIAPSIHGIKFEPQNVDRLLKLSTCKRCGRCCKSDKSVPDNPGVMVYEYDLVAISKHTNHSLKSLRRMAKVNTNPVYHVGERYLPLPCMFYDSNSRSCKIYSFRPLVCRVYPVSDSPGGEGDITIDVQCDYGKDIYRKTLKRIRQAQRESRG